MQATHGSSCTHPPILARLIDRIGAAAAFGCAIHCAALPFLLALLPALGLGFLADHRFEYAFILVASVIAVPALWHGYQHHRDRRPLWLLGLGLTLLWTGGFIVHQEIGSGLHAILVTCGGCLLALAHWGNLRISHRLAIV
jgi:hypothetical protein